jgi:hypothetical protein
VARVTGDDRIIALPSLKEFRRALRNQD